MRITQRAAERNTQVASYDTVDTVDLGGAYGLGLVTKLFQLELLHRSLAAMQQVLFTLDSHLQIEIVAR